MPESAKPRKRRPIGKRKAKLPVQLSAEEAFGLRNRIGGHQAASDAVARVERALAEARVVAGMVAESKEAFVIDLTAKYGLPEQFILNEDDTVDAPPPQIQEVPPTDG